MRRLRYAAPRWRTARLAQPRAALGAAAGGPHGSEARVWMVTPHRREHGGRPERLAVVWRGGRSVSPIAARRGNGAAPSWQCGAVRVSGWHGRRVPCAAYASMRAGHEPGRTHAIPPGETATGAPPGAPPARTAGRPTGACARACAAPPLFGRGLSQRGCMDGTAVRWQCGGAACSARTSQTPWAAPCAEWVCAARRIARACTRWRRRGAGWRHGAWRL